MTIKITTLDNGLRIATDPMPDAESVVVGAWVGVGTRHEPWNANGVAHLAEHMMFKGTKTRSAYALSSAIENKGGSMNAHTSREETAYYARVLPEEAENATDIIADMMRHSVFDPKELDRERQVIIQEIGRDLDSPEDYVFDLMHELAMPKQKIGRGILGLRRGYRQIAAFRRYPLCQTTLHRREYGFDRRRKNYARSVRGNGHETFRPLAARQKTGRTKNTCIWRRKARSQRQRTGASDPRLCRPGYHAKTAFYPTQLLSLILGGSASSRLFQKVREKRGLVYTINSAHSGFNDAGIFQIYAGTDPKRLRELMPVICDELNDVKKHVTRGELDRAKAQIRADLLMGKESVMRRAEMLGHQLLVHGKTIPIERILKKLMSVTQENVQNAAIKIFSHKPILTALGPLQELEDYKKIVERLAD